MKVYFHFSHPLENKKKENQISMFTPSEKKTTVFKTAKSITPLSAQSAREQSHLAGFTDFQKKVFKATQKIPKGKVSTYKETAKAIGHPRAHRAVGNVLNKNHDPRVPCHRVIRSNGQVGGFRRGRKAKIKKLQSEGIPIIKGRVRLEKFFRL